MPYNAANANVQRITYRITLDNITLTVDGFTLQEERPYEQQRMWNGNWYELALGKKPCHLQLQCRVAAAMRNSLLVVLRAALDHQTTYAFTLGGTGFSSLKLTGYKLQNEEGTAFCHVALTFIGVAGDPVVNP